MDVQLASLHTEFERELSGVSAHAAELHPGGDARRWSVQQVMEHLVLTYRVTQRVLKERLEKGRVTQATPGAAQWVAKQFVIGCGVMPRGRQAPANVFPGEEFARKDGAELAMAMRDGLQSMDRLLDECVSRFGTGKIASHQFFGPISAAEWRRFHQVHGRHHLRQLRRTKTGIEF